MTKAASWTFAEELQDEGELISDARDRAAGLGCRAVSPGTGSLLRLLGSTVTVRTAVEVGTGAGVSGLYLLEGLAADAVLTTIDIEAEHQMAARQAFADAGHRGNRVRVILGDAVDVLPRLAEASYDLVVIDVGAPDVAADIAGAAVSLLRPRGVLVLVDALHGDRVPDPAQRDHATSIARELLRRITGDERLLTALVPTGDGVLIATRQTG